MVSKWIRGAGFLLAVAIAVCGASAASARTHAAAATSHTLVVDTSFGLQTLDPTFGQTLTKIVSHARFDTLMTYSGSDLTPVPQIATGFKVSNGGRTYTFALNPKAKFSDGTSVTSADVVFSFERGINLKGDAGSALTGLTVAAAGKYGVVIQSSSPNAAIPAIVTSPELSIINAKATQQNGGSDAANAATVDKAGPWFSSAGSQVADSGPYKLIEYDPNSQIILGRNLHYWGNRPQFDKVIIRNVPAETQSLDVQRGTFEMALDLGAPDIAGLKKAKNVNVIATTSPQTFLMLSNDNPQVSPISANKHLQQAIRDAIDYKSIVALGGPGAKWPAGEIPPQFPGSLPASQGTKTDVAAAKKELAASGLSNPTINLECLSDRVINDLPFCTIAQRIQAELQPVGISVNIVSEPFATLFPRYIQGKIAWGLVPNLPAIDDVTELTRFMPGGVLSTWAGWTKGADPALEKLAAKAEATAGTARYAIWQQVQVKLNSDGPWIGLVNPTQVVASTKDLANVNFNAQWVVDFSQVTVAKS